MLKLQEQGDKEKLPDSAFLFEKLRKLRSCQDPWIGREIIMSRKGTF
jgi:hypothetical protein